MRFRIAPLITATTTDTRVRDKSARSPQPMWAETPEKPSQGFFQMKHCDVAVIGAGPYGLSVTAHLRAHSIDAVVFGEPMSFWHHQMPAGMLLRSPWAASHLSDPGGQFTLDAFRQRNKKQFSAPVPREQFVDYGLWFQSQVAPDVDRRTVASVEKNGIFRFFLSDGEQMSASRVVVAAGIAAFSQRPKQLANFPGTLVSHSSEHRDFSAFKNRKVVVIGGGQSALESAALLHESGADVEILVRAPEIIWLKRKKWLVPCAPLERLLYAPTDIGPAGASQFIARPNWFQKLPRAMQDRLFLRSVRPAGASWLRMRVEPININTGLSVLFARCRDNGLELALSNGRRRVVDHVLLATGYRVNISRYDFLSPQLLTSINTVAGYPRLNSRFESSVPGLHFLGAPAAWDFGPLMRFVAGTEFTARTVTRGIVESASQKYRYAE
jgi:thioredoxin reductase